MDSFTEMHSEIDVCTDCLILAANGETPHDADPNEPAPLALVTFGYYAAIGGEHRDNCDRDDETDCDCDQLGFSYSRCEGCGSGLAGDRHRMTLFRYTRRAALHSARTLLRNARVESTRARTFELIDAAAAYRRYALQTANWK